MKTDRKKPSAEDDLEVLEIKLERIPVENLAEVTATLDRIRIAAQKLSEKLAEATEMLAKGEHNEVSFESWATAIGKGLSVLQQGMKTVLGAAAAKQKLNSGK